MKRMIALLVLVSLAANAVLLVALVPRRKSADTPPPGRTGADGAVNATTAGPVGGGASPDAAAGAPGAISGPPPAIDSRSTWERLASRDPAIFNARLAAAGFSVGARRGAVYALLRDLQTTERVKAVESLPDEPYWKTNPGFSVNTSYGKEVNRLWHERDRIMRSLFPEEQMAFTLRAQARYGPLTPDKIERLSILERDYGEMRMQLMESQSPMRMPWDADRIKYLEAEKRKDLAALLTPAELEEYDLRSSMTANMLQRQLAGFDPSEREFREIFRARLPFDERMRTGLGFSNPTEYDEAQRQMSAQLKTALGETRHADYERALDPGVQASRRVAETLNLPATTANAVFELQREMRERQAAIQSDASANAAQREARLAALAQEAMQKLSTLLTPRGAEQFRRETGDRSLPILQRARGPRG